MDVCDLQEKISGCHFLIYLCSAVRQYDGGTLELCSIPQTSLTSWRATEKGAVCTPTSPVRVFLGWVMLWLPGWLFDRFESLGATKIVD